MELFYMRNILYSNQAQHMLFVNIPREKRSSD